MTQLGKFNSDRDSALHYLCVGMWSNDSTGDVEAPTGSVWRISNSWEEVKPEAMDFTSVMEEWFQAEDVQDTPEFRRSLVGHFLVVEDSNGFVMVLECSSKTSLVAEFNYRKNRFDAWVDANEDV